MRTLMEQTPEIVMYIVARDDLNMSAGKLAAQVGHGVHRALELTSKTSPAYQIWEDTGYTKIVLKVSSLQELLDLYAKVGSENGALIKDEGRTEIEPTHTVLGMIPMDKRSAQFIVGHLKLYRG